MNIFIIMGEENKNNKYTTIRVAKTTKEFLDEFGRKKETHDDIIIRLIKKYFELSNEIIELKNGEENGG